MPRPEAVVTFYPMREVETIFGFTVGRLKANGYTDAQMREILDGVLMVIQVAQQPKERP